MYLDLIKKVLYAIFTLADLVFSQLLNSYCRLRTFLYLMPIIRRVNNLLTSALCINIILISLCISDAKDSKIRLHLRLVYTAEGTLSNFGVEIKESL